MTADLADHAYVAYAADSQLRASAGGFLSEGLTLGQQVCFFGWGSSDALRAQVSGLDGLDELVRQGAVHVTSFDQHFRRDEAPSPDALVRFWSEATGAALDEGFSGLRVVTDTTPWVEAPKQRSVFLRGEHLVDRYRLDHPFAQLCAGDASILDDDALAEIACLHSSSEGFTSPFQLRAAVEADLALGGELDAFTTSLLERVMSCVRDGEASRELVIDATDLGFIDHHSLLALEQHAERTGLTSVVVRNTSRTAANLAGMLDLRRVGVKPAW